MRIPDSLSPHMRQLVDETLASFPSGELLIAVSGGPDSTVLAFLAAVRGTATLCHVNHHLGPQAHTFESSVRALSHRWELPVLLAHVDPEQLLTGPLGLEAEARNARYRAIRELGDGPIVTGHTAHDRLDTLLMRLLQGTGVDALDGPRAQVKIQGRAVHRPMLRWYEEDVAELLSALQVDAVRDPGNSDPARLRNAIRPVARALTALADRDVLTRSLSQIATDAERLRSHDDALLDSLTRAVGEETWIAAAPFAALDPTTRATMIHRLLRRLGVRGSMRFCHSGAAIGPGTSTRGAGLLIEHCGDILRVARCVGDRHIELEFERFIERGANYVETPLGRLHVDAAAKLAHSATIALAPSALTGRLRIRCLQRDDRFVPFGRENETSVFERLAKDGWSESRRRIALVLADDVGPLAVLGGRRGSRALLSPGDQALSFRWAPWTGNSGGLGTKRA